MVFHWSFKVFQESFQGVSKDFLVACHSSQLAKQMEGLFKSVLVQKMDLLDQVVQIHENVKSGLVQIELFL